jgi:hypothetical protein
MIPRGIGAPAIQIIHGYARQQAMRPAPDLLTGSVIDFQPAGAAAHLNPGAAQGHGSTRVNALMTIADQAQWIGCGSNRLLRWLTRLCSTFHGRRYRSPSPANQLS